MPAPHLWRWRCCFWTTSTIGEVEGEQGWSAVRCRSSGDDGVHRQNNRNKLNSPRAPRKLQPDEQLVTPTRCHQQALHIVYIVCTESGTSQMSGFDAPEVPCPSRRRGPVVAGFCGLLATYISISEWPLFALGNSFSGGGSSWDGDALLVVSGERSKKRASAGLSKQVPSLLKCPRLR